jgi:hypothetical protein
MGVILVENEASFTENYCPTMHVTTYVVLLSSKMTAASKCIISGYLQNECYRGIVVKSTKMGLSSFFHYLDQNRLKIYTYCLDVTGHCGHTLSRLICVCRTSLIHVHSLLVFFSLELGKRKKRPRASQIHKKYHLYINCRL